MTNAIASAAPDQLIDGFPATDTGNSDRFVRVADGRARFVAAWRRWIVYDDDGAHGSSR